ncbi:Ribosome association toxin RatA [Aquimixticola soesokkakensis]|uniref:Ribosome association toxin RatA n=1 Tax=Aquimixticola soesokkakensis TaxID=1519096 RepID=A0A1Y5SKN3_9RHOB|nr:type II toxin-antitoxin system RatA family toxin [Aquimixticola soesokkakensis]SLN41783.1 Ribosome association toxin RatA [Aquimixticola soesokkakensis]
MPTHTDRRHMPYSVEQMYDLVADVARYSEFLPWCAAARIRSQTPHEDHCVLDADLVISFKVFREKFGSRVTLWPAFSGAGDVAGMKRIDTEYLDGPFRYLKSYWQFAPAQGGGCDVEFFVDFEFKNAILQGVIGVVFNDAMQRIVRAFERRAAALYA